METAKRIVLILDVDGTLTDGRMYYTKEGKVMKSFGCDDFDALKTLSKKVDIQFISGDEKGFSISEKRAIEMNTPIALVPSDAEKRWQWMKTTFPDKTIVFIGDGINDYIALKKANYSFTFNGSLPHVLASAKSGIIPKDGGYRGVAYACMILDNLLQLDCFPQEVKKWYPGMN